MTDTLLTIQKWMSDHGVQCSLFPPKAADINPMENLWGYLSQRVFAGTKTFDCTESLLAAIEAEWQVVQQDRTIRKSLVESMVGRLQQVVDAKGACTEY